MLARTTWVFRMEVFSSFSLKRFMDFIVVSFKIAGVPMSIRKNSRIPRRFLVYFVLIAVNGKSSFRRKAISTQHSF